VGGHKPSQLLPALSQTVYNEEFSGNLGNASGFYHRRAALTLRKPSGLILVRVDTAELLTVGIKDTDEIMVMFAATIFAERSFALNPRLIGLDFCHVGHPVGKEYVQHYRREANAAQVPEEIVSRTPLHLESAQGGNRKFAPRQEENAAENRNYPVPHTQKTPKSSYFLLKAKRNF
jgi:hypothetical protein